MRTRFASPETDPSHPAHPCGLRGRSPRERIDMYKLPIAGLLGLTALGAHAQMPNLKTFVGEPVVVTATREIGPVTPTLRDAIVITREQLEEAGALSLAEVLQREANIELRAVGGPGQPVGLFVRGASPAQTLVLIDGLRVASATAGTAAIQSIPLDMIERIEIVKGPMSSLYGSDAMGGVVQIFTRGKRVPHLFGSAAYGTDNDRQLAAGLSTVDGNLSASLSMGGRKVDAPSATNERAGGLFVPDRDPHENGFANARFSWRLWQGEVVEVEGFGSRSRTRFDAGVPDDGIPLDDRSDQTITGGKITSSNMFAEGWASRLSFGHTRDKQQSGGRFPSVFETRQDQLTWVNEFGTAAGKAIVGLEGVRQHVEPDTEFSQTRRTIRSVFGSINEGWRGNRVEANARRDDIEGFGTHNTGSVSYGYEWSPTLRLSTTVGRGFRAPTFNDLFLPPIFGGNPDLKAETSKSTEVALAGRWAPVDWRITGFDNRFEDLILFDPGQQLVINVGRARVRGVELSANATWLGMQWKALATFQRPRNEDKDVRLPSRSEEYGSIDVTRAINAAWTAGLRVTANGDRFDSVDESPGSHLGGYALVDARVRYRFNKQVVAELTATNLLDKRYEGAVGFDAPRRSVMINIRFDAF
jgi:vitamin B12 transporter